MDPLSMTSSLLVVWFIQNFSIATGEAAKEIGKGAGKGIVAVTNDLVAMIYDKLKVVSSPATNEISRKIEQKSQIKKDELASMIDQLAKGDLEFSKSLNVQIQAVRSNLLDVLDNRFTARDLNEIYFRLGLDADRLAGIGAPHKTKAIELITYSETRGQLPDLIQKMIDVNPSIA